MPAPTNGRSGGGGNNKRKDAGMMENLRGACPPHKRKDLDKLVKSLNGDEAKVMEKIQEWWEEPAPEEVIWEDVNKKTAKKKPIQGGGGGGFGRGSGRTQGPGRGRGYGRGGGGGRGGGVRERSGRSGDRGRGGPIQDRKKPEEGGKSDEQSGAPVLPGIPAPVANAPLLKGAWGARAPVPPAAPASASTEPPQKTPQPKPEDSAPPLESNPLEIGMVSHNDPTPSGLTAPETKPIRIPVPVSGNVWALKGSAHLIQAEKPKAPAPVAPHTAAVPAPPVVQPAEPAFEAQPSPVVPEPILESGLSPAVWGKQPAPAPKPVPVVSPIEMTPPSPVVAKTLSNPMPVTSVEEPTPVSPEPVVVPQAPSPAAPVNVLNMGHWETGDGDDSQNLDFGFGSFGADNDAIDTSASPAAPKDAAEAAAAAVSPARPPPGLSLRGMPPMPESAVMVHELENKMESASMNSAPKQDQAEPGLQNKPISSTLPTQPTHQHPETAGHGAQVLPSGISAQPNYNQYGAMAGMYNYNAAAAGNGFVGIQAAPVLAGGVVPQHPGKPQAGGITQQSLNPNAPQTMPQQGLYGSQPPPAPSSGNAVGIESATTDAAAAGIPPGMPGAIPYANPALAAAHYGQHQFYMGQHQAGIGYNYGYGQFGGVAQGGFGYQQVMGQSQGYGAPHYDDQSHQATSHHSGGSGGYQKTSGNYRGRNNHHTNNQYQNQYNPQQHGGYGGQPYGMGYHGDHFNQQRGGYPGGMGDPYGMQQQQGSGNYQSGGIHSGGFQDDDHQKGKKGGRGNTSHNSTLQQFQQQQQQQGGPPHQLGGQQPFGAQGQGSESTPSTGAGGGWSNQAGGWSGGAPSWQGS